MLGILLVAWIMLRFASAEVKSSDLQRLAQSITAAVL
jgi:hypothetical protein